MREIERHLGLMSTCNHGLVQVRSAPFWTRPQLGSKLRVSAVHSRLRLTFGTSSAVNFKSIKREPLIITSTGALSSGILCTIFINDGMLP